MGRSLSRSRGAGGTSNGRFDIDSMEQDITNRSIELLNINKLIVLCAGLSVLSGASVMAGPPPAAKPAKKAAVKLIDVWTCPIAGEAVIVHTVKSTDPVVGKYRVHFCCAGCPEEFAKLSAKDKLAKVEAAAKKDKTVAPKT